MGVLRARLHRVAEGGRPLRPLSAVLPEARAGCRGARAASTCTARSWSSTTASRWSARRTCPTGRWGSTPSSTSRSRRTATRDRRGDRGASATACSPSTSAFRRGDRRGATQREGAADRGDRVRSTARAERHARRRTIRRSIRRWMRSCPTTRCSIRSSRSIPTCSSPISFPRARRGRGRASGCSRSRRRCSPSARLALAWRYTPLGE